VISAEEVTGPYDVIAAARPASERHLADEVVPRIRELRGVIRVLPAVVLEDRDALREPASPGRASGVAA
jgi:hypothetical protein